MRQTLLEIMVYPILLINIAIGFVMLLGTHTFALILVSRWSQDEVFRELELGSFSAIQDSVSIISIMIMAIGAIIIFPLLERYYTTGAQQGSLIRRASYVVGIQFIYLGILLGMTRLIAEVAVTIDICLMLIAGVSLLLFSKKMLRHEANNTNLLNTTD